MNNVDLTHIADYLQKKLIENFVKQGHSMNGKFESKLYYKVVDSVISEFMPEYGKYLEQGVRPSKIPFKFTGKGGTSQYITALIKYAQRRMNVGTKKATSIAFAIAVTQKYGKDKKGGEGMPTKGSYLHSKNGKRTGFIKDTLKENDQEIIKLYNKLNTELIVNQLYSVTHNTHN